MASWVYSYMQVRPTAAVLVRCPAASLLFECLRQAQQFISSPHSDMGNLASLAYMTRHNSLKAKP